MSPLIFLLLVVVAIYLVILAFFRVLFQRKEVKELKRLAITERNRNRFGALRTDLMSLAREKKINIESPLFQALYGFATTLMRNPHLYRDAVHGILILPNKIESTGNLNLSEDECKMLLLFAKNLDELCRDYSPIYRYAARYFDRRSTIPQIPLWMKTEGECEPPTANKRGRKRSGRNYEGKKQSDFSR